MPVVPPVEEFVRELLARTKRSPDEVVLTMSHLHRTCNVRQAAINAVMAGCLPEHFPVVLAGLDAFEATNSGVLMQSTTGQALALVVNGPVRERLQINCRDNLLGSGDRANAVISRALRLVMLNVMDVRPHDLDQSTQATPAKYACCFGENEEESPWSPAHVDRGFAATDSTVMAQLVRCNLHVEHRSTQTPEHILQSIADAMSYTGNIYEAPPYNRNNAALVVMGPEHAAIIAAKGWTKQAVRRWLYDRWGNTMADLRRVGKIIGLEDQPDEAFIHSSRSVDMVNLVVAGASNAGVSTVFLSFVMNVGIAKVEEA
jgi:hypothetical protein